MQILGSLVLGRVWLNRMSAWLLMNSRRDETTKHTVGIWLSLTHTTYSKARCLVNWSRVSILPNEGSTNGWGQHETSNVVPLRVNDFLQLGTLSNEWLAYQHQNYPTVLKPCPCMGAQSNAWSVDAQEAHLINTAFPAPMNGWTMHAMEFLVRSISGLYVPSWRLCS